MAIRVRGQAVVAGTDIQTWTFDIHTGVSKVDTDG